MKEAAKIYYLIVDKNINMSNEINRLFKNQSSIISRNYCSEEMHVPPYMDAILPEPVDFNKYNLIVIMIGNNRIKQQIEKLKKHIKSYTKPRLLTLAKWRSFQKYLLAFMIINYFDIKTNTEVIRLSGLSESYLRNGLKKINYIIDDPDDYYNELKEIVEKTIKHQLKQ